MADLDFLNLASIFSSKGAANCNHARRCCYNDALAYLKYEGSYKTKYHIEIKKGTEHLYKTRDNNACFLDMGSINNHLEEISKIYDKINYEVEETDKEFFIDIEIEGTRAQHTMVLTWIRHLYEYPYNMFLLEALQMKNAEPEKYGSELLINLIQVTASSYPGSYRTDQCLFYPGRKFHTLDSIKSRLKTTKYITNIYEEKLGQEVPKYDDTNIFNIDFWRNLDNFMMRLSVYDNVYEIYQKKGVVE